MTTTYVTCISDLHGCQPSLRPGHLLIIAGDLTAHDTEEQYENFAQWIKQQPFEKIIIAPGNHDTLMQIDQLNWEPPRNVELLIDEESVYHGLIIYATPWTLKFHGQNPNSCAYTAETEAQLEQYFSRIPQDTDILITHSPPMGVNATTVAYSEGGSYALLQATTKLPYLKLHTFGHIHEARGISMRYDATSPHICVNASYVDRNYQPYKQRPITVTLHH